jgi:hypothetical protein
MKCPKCGFNSFEFHDNCKKCGKSLAAFKMDLNINPVIFSANRPLPGSAPSRPINAEAPLANEETGDTFTWDMPEESETASPADTTFSGFELDFLKEDVKPADQEAAFSFGEDPVPEAPALPIEENVAPLGDFSFYEETIEPGENQLFNGTEEASPEDGTSLFGETGVIGEILPEKLQDDIGELDPADIIDDSPPEWGKFEKEFDPGSFSAEGCEEENKNNEVKKASSNFTDFEKEFESIFQTGETTDQDKPEI